ncbi:hypothetical protein GGX14DRAFT_537765 [Mycena pura]|uniref:Uncharacterized protein n=1 Tax=Mycena pura TaxID=153505 RepID=A0AAD6XZM1_9AGAR|nr:hypothetical protein GGX14DRAFT_537765 [Mycena pura]
MEVYLQHAGDQIRCLVCAKVGKVGIGGWFSRKNLKAHLGTPTHAAAYNSETQKARRDAEERERFSEAYNAFENQEFPEINSSGPSHVAQMFPQPEDDIDMDTGLAPVNLAHLMEELGGAPEPEVLGPEATRLLLQQEFERMLEDAYQETHLGAGVEDQFVADELPKIGDEDDDEDTYCFDSELVENDEYFPYPNKTIMLLDIMDNLPRCRFTGDQISLILHFATKLGVANVPSLKSFRKIQKTLQLSCGNKPKKSTSHLGNIFYMNDIRETLAADMANPLVAPHLHFYPEETTGPISETFQAERWMEYTPSQLTPMHSRGNKRFWIEEIAQLFDGRFVIPHTWIVRNGELTADVSFVARTGDGRWKLEDGLEQTVNLKALDLQDDFDFIHAVFGNELSWVDARDVPPMPNSMRELVEEDEDLFVIMVSPWADDVSGNRSKQYNKHMNMCAGNGCLPGRMLQQEFHIHYISTSPHASSAEQFATFRDHVRCTETAPVKCFNAATKRKCRFIIRTPGLTGDNPQQSDEASHMGESSLPKKEKETEKLYHECHLAGVARNVAEIRENLEKQLRMARHGDKKGIEDLQRSTGTKDKITQHWIEALLKKVTALRLESPRRTKDDIASELQIWLDQQPGDKFNPLLDITGLDPSQDTPVELLHTVLLGVVKYIWHILNTSQWSDADRHLLAIRLQSTDISGLTVPPLRAGYMIQYRNNLIGKHFKTLTQTLTFHVHKICNPEQFVLIKAAGDLGPRLWVPEIDNMDKYIAQLKIAVANLLDAFDAVDPLRILVKIKLHLLAHLPDDIRRFGPSIRFATEIYEAYNGVFRLCSIYSNRLAPSRDISLKFAAMDRDHTSKQWIQAGGAVQKVLQADPVFQRHLGWVPHAEIDPGKIKPQAAGKNPVVRWEETVASRFWTENSAPVPDSQWKRGTSASTDSGDNAPLGSWVFCRDSGQKTIIGRVHELLIGPRSLVTIERFILTSTPHVDFGWPVLRRPHGSEITEQGIGSYLVLDTIFLQHLCSVQHDCRMGECQPTLSGREFQEREATGREIQLIKHTDDDHFVLNLSAFHNFVRVCRALPRHFTELSPIIQDRVEFHKQASLKAQATGTTKRQQAAARKRERAEAKKREASEAEAAAQRAEDPNADDEDSDSDEQGTGDFEEELPVVVPRQSSRKRRRVVDDSEDSEDENQQVEVDTGARRQSTRQRRAPNRLDL